VTFFSALQAPQHNPLPTAPIDSPTLRLQPPPTGCPAALSRLLVPPLVPTTCRHFHPSRRRLLVGYAATRLDTLFIPRPAPLLSPLPPRSSAHLFHSRDPSSRPPIGVNNVSPLPPLAPPSPGRFAATRHVILLIPYAYSTAGVANFYVLLLVSTMCRHFRRVRLPLLLRFAATILDTFCQGHRAAAASLFKESRD
jgi:hypothetical protein